MERNFEEETEQTLEADSKKLRKDSSFYAFRALMAPQNENLVLGFGFFSETFFSHSE